MKVHFIAYNIYGMGGTVRTVVNTANYLANNGYSVEIISIKRTSQNPLFSIDKKIKLTPLIDVRQGYLFPQNKSLIKKILKKIMLKIPSILVDRTEDLYKNFNLLTDLKLLRIMKKIKKGYLVTTIPSFNIMSAKYVSNKVIKIGQEHKYFNGHSQGLKKKIKKSYNKLNILTCLTDSEVDQYKSVLAPSNLCIVKIENATELLSRTSRLDSKTVISAGRFSYEKGYDLLIQVFARIAQVHPEWKLKIFGAGAEERKLKQLIANLKAHNNIFLIPTSNSIKNEMMEASLYVVSSRHESFGMSIIEAMSVGLPCVSFSCSGPKEIIRDRVDGILVNEGDLEGLERAILELIENKNLRLLFGENARANVRRYSMNAIGNKWVKLLESSYQHLIKTS